MSEQKSKKVVKTEARTEAMIKGSEIKTYIVKQDDKLAKIATEQGVSVGELVEKNKLDSYKLSVGQELAL